MGGHELTSSVDGSLMIKMAKHADCADITAVTDGAIGNANFPVRRLVLERIYQISASLDHQEAEDTGKGGVLTWALKRTLLKQAVRCGRQEFSMQRVFEGCKKRVKRITDEQEVSVQFSGMPPDRVAWPLCFPIWKWAAQVPDDLKDHELK